MVYFHYIRRTPGISCEGRGPAGADRQVHPVVLRPRYASGPSRHRPQLADRSSHVKRILDGQSMTCASARYHDSRGPDAHMAGGTQLAETTNCRRDASDDGSTSDESIRARNLAEACQPSLAAPRLAGSAAPVATLDDVGADLRHSCALDARQRLRGPRRSPCGDSPAQPSHQRCLAYRVASPSRRDSRLVRATLRFTCGPRPFCRRGPSGASACSPVARPPQRPTRSRSSNRDGGTPTNPPGPLETPAPTMTCDRRSMSDIGGLTRLRTPGAHPHSQTRIRPRTSTTLPTLGDAAHPVPGRSGSRDHLLARQPGSPTPTCGPLASPCRRYSRLTSGEH